MTRVSLPTQRPTGELQVCTSRNPAQQRVLTFPTFTRIQGERRFQNFEKGKAAAIGSVGPHTHVPVVSKRQPLGACSDKIKHGQHVQPQYMRLHCTLVAKTYQTRAIFKISIAAFVGAYTCRASVDPAGSRACACVRVARQNAIQRSRRSPHSTRVMVPSNHGGTTWTNTSTLPLAPCNVCTCPQRTRRRRWARPCRRRRARTPRTAVRYTSSAALPSPPPPLSRTRLPPPPPWLTSRCCRFPYCCCSARRVR